jgi:hypothetical protein
MNPGDARARIAEKQIGTLGDPPSGRVALYCYLMATEADSRSPWAPGAGA